jgi:hypothetical protein
MYGAAFIGFRLTLVVGGAEAERSAAERETKHGESLFVVCDSNDNEGGRGTSFRTPNERTVALRLARSVGKRLMQVSRSGEAPGGFVVEPVVS